MRKGFQGLKNAGIAIALCISLTGCGGGDGSGPTVSGVAATGAPVSGTAFLKDAAGSPEMTTSINARNGVFSFDVSGKTPPFLLRAGSLYSMSGGPGTANINPLTNLIVADMGGFSNMSSLNTFYRNPDRTRMNTMFGNMSTSRTRLHQTMEPLMSAYGVAGADPVKGQFTIGQGMDRMFDDVKMGIDQNGNVTMMYVNGTQVYSGTMVNISGGTMMSGNIMTPGAPATSGVTITPASAKVQVGGTQQFTATVPVTWSVVSTNGGTISEGGLYTAPARQGMYLIKGTSTSDPTKSATATVMVGSTGMMM
ncbi:hypothetical protein [Geobacter sp. DSM 9736]|uniref:hypothetical protein n=1 Tax=Geobacter sp. DSM 9736 TaxID=1277350 RepID=UPI000B50E9FE|nr:hypothetical protein [Geobacter sp. DSM 9736]SNB45366.1 hypothetical protein SAMN06269301_0779 [Geobacter sp. DSM 9736]